MFLNFELTVNSKRKYVLLVFHNCHSVRTGKYLISRGWYYKNTRVNEFLMTSSNPSFYLQ